MRQKTNNQAYNFIEDYLTSPSLAVKRLKEAADAKEWPEGPTDEELFSFEYMSLVQYVIDDTMDGYCGNEAA